MTVLDPTLVARLVQLHAIARNIEECDAAEEASLGLRYFKEQLVESWPSISAALSALQSENARMREALDECERCADAAIAVHLVPSKLNNAERTALKFIVGAARDALADLMHETELLRLEARDLQAKADAVRCGRLDGYAT